MSSERSDEPQQSAADSHARAAGGSVCAVIVTYNRRALLHESLTAITRQLRSPDAVIVVDNASEDGTGAMVADSFPQVELMELAHNAGAAAGFNLGIRTGFERGFDWLWLMDDDTVPNPDALERLLGSLPALAELPPPQLLASRVVWSDGHLHPKNLPNPRTDERWRETLLDSAARGVMLIRNASFVSVLVHRSAVERHGLPHSSYFIWGDDYEYTARILRDAAGYLVPDSVVLHKTPRPESVHREGSPRYYYEVRNKLLMLRGDSFTSREKVLLLVALVMGISQYLLGSRFRPRALALLLRAFRDGISAPVAS